MAMANSLEMTTIHSLPPEMREMIMGYLDPMEKSSVSEALPNLFEGLNKVQVVSTSNFIWKTGKETLVIALPDVDWPIPTRTAFRESV